jgi:membrane protein required for beta-lactamase induction
MKLLALILGFGLEHFATQLLHLRELRALDGLFDFGIRLGRQVGNIAALAIVVTLLAVATAPVVAAHLVLAQDTFGWQFAYVAFALLVVFLCLGPRDLESEVDEYCAALDAGDEERARIVLVELSEAELREADEVEAVERAIFVQAPNRIFGVVFWFVLLGPVGAWLFRTSDLCRRRAAFEATRTAGSGATLLKAINQIHALLLWVPVRLAALGYALSGSFDDAWERWRSGSEVAMSLHRRNDSLVADVGRAAMTGSLDEPENSSLAARNAMRLVTRTLFIWLTIIALMTLFGWAL